MNPPEVRIVSLSFLAEDAAWLSGVGLPAFWKVESCASLESALSEAAAGNVPVVLCDSDADPDAWRTLLAGFHRLSHPPCLIVTSRRADDRLWAEALNLGAYDVLAKPFDSREVLHALSRAHQHWSMPAPVPVEPALSSHAGTAAA